jgi:hypothetical protein
MDLSKKIKKKFYHWMSSLRDLSMDISKKNLKKNIFDHQMSSLRHMSGDISKTIEK